MELMLTTKEAAEVMRMSAAWFERQRWLGQGPKFVKIGRSVRYRRADLEAYMRSRTSGEG